MAQSISSSSSQNASHTSAGSSAAGGLSNGALLLGRLMLGPVFLTAGYHKVTHMSGVLKMMQQHGVSGVFFWPVVALEILGAASLMCGFLTRFLAICFAIFCVLTGILFHIDGASGVPAVVGGLKDFALSGGFVVLAAAGAGLYSVDAWVRQHL